MRDLILTESVQVVYDFSEISTTFSNLWLKSKIPPAEAGSISLCGR